MIQCKLCGTPLGDERDVREHRLNNHAWYKGETIVKDE